MLVTKENQLQIQRAWLLARAYNHAWGEVPYDVITNAKSWADVVDAVLSNHTPGLPYGYDKPTIIENEFAPEDHPHFGEQNVFHHVTATGRLQWFIEPSGVTTFFIMRAGGKEPCLIARVDELGGHTITTGEGEFGLRHIDALKVALHAVGVTADVPDNIFLAAIDQDTADMRQKLRQAANLLESAAANADDWQTCHLLAGEIERHMYAQTEVLDKKRAELIKKYEAADATA